MKKKHWWPMILRSTDSGRTFDLWSEIPYAPDAAVDPKAATRNGFTEPTVCFLPDGSVLCLMRTTDGGGPGPLYSARSTDNGKTWSQPAVFDDLGVWPQMLRLKNGVTLAVYGRPGLYVRATADPAGLRWAQRVTIVPPGAIHTETCSYAALLPLSDDRALLAYSDFNLPNQRYSADIGHDAPELYSYNGGFVRRDGHWIASEPEVTRLHQSPE